MAASFIMHKIPHPAHHIAEVVYMKIRIEFHVREIRQERGLTIRQLADLSGVSKSNISALEKGEIMPTVHTMCCLAVALGVELGDLISYKVV